jgi:membrane-bound lytic murein transglycosylase D
VVMPGETLWSISQKYGIRLSSLKAKNRIRTDEDLIPGMMLNLQDHRKRGEDFVMVSGQEYRKMLEALVGETKEGASTPAAPQSQTTRAQEPQVQTVPPTSTPPSQPTTPTRVEPSPAAPVTGGGTVEPVRERPSEASPRPEPPRATPSVHKVAAGETLFRISQMYGVSVEELKRLNNLPDNTIKVGQEIRLSPSNQAAPSSSSTPSVNRAADGSIVHTVLPGETLFRLGQTYGVSIEDIKRWNNLPDNTIMVGQKIRIVKP